MLVLGVPRSLPYFAAFFTKVAYEVGDYLLSPAELEHGALCAALARPAQVLAPLFLP
ncbi:unnamed protein product, partial [Heterosigma akashiwo]